MQRGDYIEFFSYINSLNAISVPSIPRVRNTIPPTPPLTVNIVGNPTVMPNTIAQGPHPPKKNAEVPSAVTTDAQTISEGANILRTPPIMFSESSIREEPFMIALANSFSFCTI